MGDVKRILVVEDSPTMRHLIAFALTRMSGVEILQAEEGVAALKCMTDRQVDLLITDINMPIMDGLKLVSMVRRDERHKHIPILVITTEGASEDRAQAMALGATAYLAKPVQGSVVMAKVRELLGLT
jgi:two-component system chemotaxis response regulator CheY